MNVQELASAWTERNERARKPIPVEIAGVGTAYVRVIMVEEAEYAAELMKTGDGAGENEALIMAWLMCHESGERLTEQERAMLLPILRKATRGDYNVMWQAATQGVSKPNGKGDDAGN